MKTQNRKIPEFKVLLWDFNRKDIEFYDIIPYLLEQYKERKKKNLSYNELKDFIQIESQYQFWSRCQYELIVVGFPVQEGFEKKIDVYDQIEANLDTITDLIYNYLYDIKN